jgi:hypothetical protein
VLWQKEYLVKRLAAAFALSALAAATVGLAQQATQQTPTQPPPAADQAPPPSDSGSTNQAPSPSGPSAGTADKQSLMKDCMAQLQAANPNVPLKEIQVYCDDQVKKLTSQPN